MTKFNEWRKRTNAGIPTLAARVFALRGRMYAGAGFHYGMERKLGFVLHRLNDYETMPTIDVEVILEIAVEELYRDVQLAEASAQEWDRQKT